MDILHSFCLCGLEVGKMLLSCSLRLACPESRLQLISETQQEVNYYGNQHIMNTHRYRYYTIMGLLRGSQLFKYEYHYNWCRGGKNTCPSLKYPNSPSFLGDQTPIPSLPLFCLISFRSWFGNKAIPTPPPTPPPPAANLVCHANLGDYKIGQTILSPAHRPELY